MRCSFACAVTWERPTPLRVRAGVEEALKNKLDDEALAALDFLVNRYFVRPSNRADAPKDILLQVIASVNDEMGID